MPLTTGKMNLFTVLTLGYLNNFTNHSHLYIQPLSTYVPAQLTKDKVLVHHIDTLTKIDVKIDKAYISLVAKTTQKSF